MNVATLLHYRAQLEDALRVELAAVEQRVRLAQDGLRRLEAEVDQGAEQLVLDAREGLAANEAQGRYLALGELREAIRKAGLAVEEAHRLRDAKMAEVLEANREKKKLDILDRRYKAQERREQERREQADSDDMAGRRLAAESVER